MGIVISGRRPRGISMPGGIAIGASGAGLGGSSGPVFLLRDDFNTPEAAPLASPHTAVPGPGTLTLVQVDGEFSTVGGNLVFPAQATANFGDQGFYGGSSFVRTAGRALLTTINKGQTNKQTHPLAWSTTQVATFTGINGYSGIWLDQSGQIQVTSNAAAFIAGTYSASTDYKWASVLRGTGAFLLIKGGAFTSWTLIWVDVAGTSTPLYPIFINYDSSGTLDTLRVLDLPAPFNTDYGLATQQLAGARAAGDTFTHEANCVIEWTQTTLPSSGTQSIAFRRVDLSNYWDVVTTSGGAFNLREIVAGGATTRASYAGLANGERCVIVCDGSTIRGYSNNVLRWTYSSASNFATATIGKADSLGTGGAIADIVSWPRQLNSAAAALLDAAVA